MEAIKNWINKGMDYDQGLILIAKYHKNRMLARNLTRKCIPEKLEYELRKISGLANYKPTPAAKPPTPAAKPPTPPAKPEKPIQPAQKPAPAPTPAGYKFEIVDPESRKVNKKDLPESLQVVYDTIVEKYRKARSVHEKLKLLNDAPAAVREMHVAHLVDLDMAIRGGWAQIDAWDGKPIEPEPEPEKPLVDHKRINSNRKFISTNIKKMADKKLSPMKKERLKENIQERINELKMAGEEISEKTTKELIAFGFDA